MFPEVKNVFNCCLSMPNILQSFRGKLYILLKNVIWFAQFLFTLVFQHLLSWFERNVWKDIDCNVWCLKWIMMMIMMMMMTSQRNQLIGKPMQCFPKYSNFLFSITHALCGKFSWGILRIQGGFELICSTDVPGLDAHVSLSQLAWAWLRAVNPVGMKKGRSVWPKIQACSKEIIFLAPYGGLMACFPLKKQQNFENEVSQDSEWLRNCISRDV